MLHNVSQYNQKYQTIKVVKPMNFHSLAQNIIISILELTTMRILVSWNNQAKRIWICINQIGFESGLQEYYGKSCNIHQRIWIISNEYTNITVPILQTEIYA